VRMVRLQVLYYLAWPIALRGFVSPTPGRFGEFVVEILRSLEIHKGSGIVVLDEHEAPDCPSDDPERDIVELCDRM
jgi:hypothetical protein